MSPQIIGLDFETSCELELKDVGLDRYIEHPSFRVLCAAISREDARTITYDFLTKSDSDLGAFREVISRMRGIVAHNVTFERRVLQRMGINTSHIMFYDSAVIARCIGGDSKLAYAAPQLLGLGSKKVEAGTYLINKFCHGENLDPDGWSFNDLGDWQDMLYYCAVDAELSLDLYSNYAYLVNPIEHEYEVLTNEMNQQGWYVDQEAVRVMQEVSEDNRTRALQDFQMYYDMKGELNFNSPKQLAAWCRARHVRLASFTEERVATAISKLEKRIYEQPGHKHVLDYHQVVTMLKTKQILGGSSLKKLNVIENTISEDGRLRNQYMHCGAGQTYRTTGKGVQMQNLKRLRNIREIDELIKRRDWSNTEMAENLRQVFCASEPEGKIIVSDFSAVESRGLAYLAGAEWKLDAYRKGRDLYKVNAQKIAAIHGDVLKYEDVTKEQRAGGKLGELACQYQAGGRAIAKFAGKMGVAMTQPEAEELKDGWRQANPEIVRMWGELDSALHVAAAGREATRTLGNGMILVLRPFPTPDSLTAIHPGVQSIEVRLGYWNQNVPVVRRVIHGLHVDGDNLVYYKSTSAGQRLWTRKYRITEPGEPAVEVLSTIYGGKLTGILTQSLCREIFFERLQALSQVIRPIPNLTIVGQFHDEVGVEWLPREGGARLQGCVDLVQNVMSNNKAWPDFPLAAATAFDYRYIK